MPSIHHQLATELLALEAALREQRLWHDLAPTDEALSSTAPFACDTLLFTEWLQFIFIPRLGHLAHSGAPLPDSCAVAPMAEEYFRANDRHGAPVLAILTRIDLLISENDQSPSS